MEELHLKVKKDKYFVYICIFVFVYLFFVSFLTVCEIKVASDEQWGCAIVYLFLNLKIEMSWHSYCV